MYVLVIVIQISLLLFVLVVGFFNWLYAKEVSKAKRVIGIVLPEGIEKLLAANSALPFLAALIILILLVFYTPK